MKWILTCSLLVIVFSQSHAGLLDEAAPTQVKRTVATDSVVTLTISNKGDTTKQITYPSHQDAELKPQAESIASSLSFMAVMSGISVALSIATFIAFLAK